MRFYSNYTHIVAEKWLDVNAGILFSFQANDECSRCGSTEQRILATEPSNPHAGKLECAQCEKYIKWIGKAELARILGGAA